MRWCCWNTKKEKKKEEGAVRTEREKKSVTFTRGCRSVVTDAVRSGRMEGWRWWSDGGLEERPLADDAETHWFTRTYYK